MKKFIAKLIHLIIDQYYCIRKYNAQDKHKFFTHGTGKREKVKTNWRETQIWI